MKLQQTYSPQEFEKQIYAKWEKQAAFNQQYQAGQKTFTVVLPPPNANASLHIGHALDFQIKDVVGRHRRLEGDFVLLLPGADHAGFETWVVYEKHLNAQGKSRFDFQREELYQQVYDFVLENKAKMQQQIKRLGISCNWQKFTFSLDEKIVDSAYETFYKMWQAKLIYRAKKLINYCVKHGTGFSDFEVSHQNVKGRLWFIKYPLKEQKTNITIATTRPETLLGDVAIAVHPSDQRYQHLIGQRALLPLTDREIPIIADKRVQSDFGTGAVKITPAHDFLDFEIGSEHQLQPLEVISKEGLLNENVPKKFVGLRVDQGRKAVVERLKKENLLEKVLDYEHQVGHCYKCESVLEPLLADQWFVDMKLLAKAVIKSLEADEVKIYPASKKQELITYLSQLQDWNISRQIAWGIPIPVFQSETDQKDWVFDRRVDQKTIEKEGRIYRRDPDVFDTWWSSGQWAFATVDWQKEAHLYPQTLMETGVDILRPWVSRMLMLSLYITKKVPFKNIYLHGMVVDKNGSKMSKSKGNVVNPMTVIDEYGSDALRLGLCSQITPGKPQKFTPDKILAGRNFCNKLWNIARFVQTETDQQPARLSSKDVDLKTAADHWLWQRFLQSKKTLDLQLKNYRLSQALETLLDFVWNDLADWYLEASKVKMNVDFLGFVFRQTLKLVHPFAPFVSEALYQELFATKGKPLLINAVWDKKSWSTLEVNQAAATHFESLKTLVTQTRQAVSLDFRQKGCLWVKNERLLDEKRLIQRLTAVADVQLVDPNHDQPGLLVNQAEGYEAWLSLTAVDLQAAIDKLSQAISGCQSKKEVVQKRLANRSYLEKAPPQLIQASQQQLESLAKEIATFKAEQAELKLLL